MFIVAAGVLYMAKQSKDLEGIYVCSYDVVQRHSMPRMLLVLVVDRNHTVVWDRR